jgi:hypothetical protein
MTDLSHDGFNHYGPGTTGRTNMLAGPYAEVANASDAGCFTPAWGARTGSYALSNSAFASDQRYRRVTAATHTALVVSCGYSVPSMPPTNARNAVVGFLDGSNNVIAELWLTTTGALELRNSAGTVLASTAGPVIVAANWHHLEMQIDTAASTFVLRVDDAAGNGPPAINASSLGLSSTAIAQYRVLHLPVASGGWVQGWMADLIVRSTAGSVNNGFVGDTRVATLFPASDTSVAGWTPRFRHNIGNGILDNTANSNSGVTLASTTGTDLGSGDYTIEGFVRFKTTPTGSNKATLFGKWDETNNRRSYQLYLGGPSLDSGRLCFRTSTSGAAGTVVQKILYPWTPVLDTWYNIALVRTSGELLLFVNGVQLGLPIADSDTYYVGTETTALGVQDDSGSQIANTALNGWLDEVRLTVGYARYTGAFTPTAVPFPRNVGGDPQFADVQFLAGFDSGVFDESSFARTLTPRNGAAQQTPDDGPAIGAFSTINKTAPADDTFLTAPLLPAMDVLTLSANVADGDTVTVGTKDGSVAAVYRFKNTMAAVFDVKIGADAPTTLQNLYNAVNAGAGSGTAYYAGTTANYDVSASQLPGDQMLVSANTPGTAGNSIAATVSLTHGGSWATSTLAGGTSIPGPSEFTMQRPPPLTTTITGVSIVQRTFKSDAGTCNVKSSLVGPLGGHTDGSSHALTVTPVYYEDVYETDPDTAGPITPSTLVGGRVRLTRTA